MGNRTSPARSIPGNPLAGVLRNNARMARSTAGRQVPGPQGPTGAPGTPGATGTPGVPGTTVAVTRLVSAVDGTFTWTFATPYAAVPVITATAEHPTLHVLATLTSVTATAATGILWDVTGAVAAGGASVALMAVST